MTSFAGHAIETEEPGTLRYRQRITARSGKRNKGQTQPGNWVGDAPGFVGFFLAVI